MSTPRTDALLSAALSYAARGWCVMPLHTPTGQEALPCTCGRPDCDKVGKHPRINAWPETATTDEKTIRQWWQRWPKANVGILAGERSGIWVTDSDGEEGLTELARLQGLHDQIPLTPYSRTASGVHYVWQYVPGLKNEVRFAPGLDIRTDGGQIVAPPSVHKTGVLYEWGEFAAEPVAAPDWLVEVARTARGTAKRNGTDGTAGPIPKGQRNQTLWSNACAMRRRDMSEREIAAAITLANEERCDPPLPGEVVQDIARRAAEYEPAPSETVVPDESGEEGADPHDPFSRGSRRASEVPMAEEPPKNWFGLYRGTVTLLIGETGAGKSSLLYNIAVHAARNADLWDIGFGGGRPLTVYYIDPENSGNWEEGHGGLCAVKLERINQGKPEGLIFHDGAGVNLSDPLHLDCLRRKLIAEKIDMCMIDPMANLFNTQDENDNAEAARQMKALIRLSRETGVTIIVCHHTGKEQGGIYGRGASARLAAADVGLVFRTKGDTEEVDDDYSGTTVERDDVCRLQIVKNRLEGRGSLYLRMAGEDRFDRINFNEWQKAAAVPQQSKAERCREEIMLLLADGLWHARAEILAAMQTEKFGRGLCDQTIKKFLEEGFIEERRGMNNAAEYRWLTPEDQGSLSLPD